MKFNPIPRLLPNTNSGLGLALDITEEWPETQTATLKSSDILIEPGPMSNLRMGDMSLTSSCLRDMATLIGFPYQFVSTMPTDLRADVVMFAIENFSDLKQRDIQFVARGNKIIGMNNARRPILNDRDIVLASFNFLNEVFPDRIKVDKFVFDTDLMIRFTTPFKTSITPKQGDVIEAYIEVRYSFADGLSVQIYIKRLICTNGMTANEMLYNWRGNQADSMAQLEWLAIGIADVLSKFGDISTNAKTMALTSVGNPESALRQRVIAMGIPKRYHQTIMEHFLEEPGNTEWDMLNAVTHAATHSQALPQHIKDAIQAASGNWVSSFNIVTARLPLTIAKRINAEIIDEG